MRLERPWWAHRHRTSVLPNDLAFLLRAPGGLPDREVQAEYSGPCQSLRDTSKRLLDGNDAG